MVGNGPQALLHIVYGISSFISIVQAVTMAADLGLRPAVRKRGGGHGRNSRKLPAGIPRTPFGIWRFRAPGHGGLETDARKSVSSAAPIPGLIRIGKPGALRELYGKVQI